MKKKRIILGILIVSIIGSAWFGLGEYNRKVKDLNHVKAQVTIQSEELIKAYETDETASNDLYLDKIIAVKGNVKAIDKDEMGHYTIVLGREGSMSSVRCSMDSTYITKMRDIAVGSRLTVKGACTGFNADELLGSDVILNRCVIN